MLVEVSPRSSWFARQTHLHKMRHDAERDFIIDSRGSQSISCSDDGVRYSHADLIS